MLRLGHALGEPRECMLVSSAAESIRDSHNNVILTMTVHAPTTLLVRFVTNKVSFPLLAECRQIDRYLLADASWFDWSCMGRFDDLGSSSTKGTRREFAQPQPTRVRPEQPLPQ